MCIDQLKPYVDVFLSVATVGVYVLGGVWAWGTFIRTRQRFPRVRPSHSLEQVPIDQTWRLVRVSLTIDNQGNVLIRPGTIDTRLLSLKPWPEEVKTALNNTPSPSALPPCKDLLDYQGMLRSGESEFQWPTLAQRTFTPEKMEIEPNETETIFFDFVIDRHWRTILVYSHITNRSKCRKNLGWAVTSQLDLTDEEAHNVQG